MLGNAIRVRGRILKGDGVPQRRPIVCHRLLVIPANTGQARLRRIRVERLLDDPATITTMPELGGVQGSAEAQ